MKKQMVGEVPGNLLGMLADLLHKIQHGIITVQELGRFLKGENPFETPSYHKLVLEWEKFYQKVFNISVDLSQVRIPKPKQGFNWLIIMIQEMTAQRLFDKCKELFGAWKWIDKNWVDLDQTKSVRNLGNGPYAIWVRDRVEADDTNDLQNFGSGITLEERLLLELFYWWKTKKHLDIFSWTLCSGSQCSVGNVPLVGWRGSVSELSVRWYVPGNAYDRLRSREVVS